MAGFGSESGADALFTQNARVGPALAFYLSGHSTTQRYADLCKESHMELVILPQGLFIFYGALVLSCGVGLGTVLGRNLLRRRHAPIPEPPDLLQQRVALLAQELDETVAQLARLTEEREFMRELERPRPKSIAA